MARSSGNNACSSYELR